MSAALTLTPASGHIVHAKTVVRVDVTGGSSNDTTGYSTATYPTEPELRCRIYGTASGVDTLVSPEFAVSHDGKWTWNSVIFPAAGSWTLTLKDASNNTLATAGATVS